MTAYFASRFNARIELDDESEVRIQRHRDIRVCHLISSLKFGGAERQFVNALNHLPYAEKFAVFLRPESPGGLYAMLDDDVQRVSLGVERRRYAPYYVWKLSQFLRSQNITILHAHTFWPSLYGTLAAKLAGVPVVITSEHGKNPWKNPFHRWLERSVVSHIADMRICVSEDILRLRRDIDGISAEKLTFIPNGTETPEVVRRDSRAPLVVGAVGRLIDAKDYETLIRAARNLRNAGFEFELHIVGDGPRRGVLESLVLELRLESVVKLCGFRQDIDRCLAAFDIFVMSSIREGQPMALLEAMAHGLPVVATKVGGIPKTVLDGREGLLVEPGDPNGLASAIQALLDDNAKRLQLGSCARQRVVRDFSIQSISERNVQLYESILKKKRHEDRVGHR